MLKTYLTKVLETARQGDAREESYYSALEDLLKEFAEKIGKKGVHVTILPKKTEAGNPDFRVWDGKRRITGYFEVKTPDKNLDDIEKTEQIIRYKETFKNLVLTNLFEFRLYKDKVCVAKVRIADPMTVYNLRGVPIIEKESDFKRLFEEFYSFSLPSITSAQQLAVELAKRTRFLRDEVIAEEISEEEESGLYKILGFYEAFQKYLIRGLTKVQFADLYSQTITYGLFASRMRCEGDFNRKVAVYDIPHTIGILREMFNFISLGDLPPQMEWIVDEISDVLASVDVKGIFSEYFKTRKGMDPVFHFYETFLTEYDPELKEKRGVYYTPEPVVSYIVRSLSIILQEKFSLKDGLAETNLTLLDPAGGTLTFLADAIKQSVDEFVGHYGEGGKKDFIREHILEDFYSFELMVAPYAIGHLKISFILEELGCSLLENERLKFFLTNTLDLEEIEQTALPGMASLAEESRKAGEVKKRIPIFAIIGNPPYSGISANRGKWISSLIESYKYVDGKHFGERKHWLHDDYVKFIRFAEWKINQIGKGVVGYITNHSYLDNPTFRGMRQHLMNSFDEIYILDLHGNSLKKEKCPDGTKDENVFDIRQGVAISFFIKKLKEKKEKCRIFHSEIWGLRDFKYDQLSTHDFSSTEWQKIQPSQPEYFFYPRKGTGLTVYNKFWKITDVFLLQSTGVQTSRDKFVIDFDRKALEKRIAKFRDMSMTDDVIKQVYRLKDTRGWKISKVRKELSIDKNWKEYFTKILYRPFDVREIYYTQKMIDWPRLEVMKHMMKPNIAMCVGRAGHVVGVDAPWNIVFCSEIIEDLNLFYRGGNVNFPLYTYKNKNKITNINASLLAAISDAFGKAPSPERIFYYIYAILYSNTYRERYAEFLRTDFPPAYFPEYKP